MVVVNVVAIVVVKKLQFMEVKMCYHKFAYYWKITKY